MTFTPLEKVTKRQQEISRVCSVSCSVSVSVLILYIEEIRKRARDRSNIS